MPPETDSLLDEAPTSEPKSYRYRRNSTLYCFYLFVLVGIVLFLLILYGLVIQTLLCIDPFFPTIGPLKPWPEFRNTTLGIGFDLSAGYGTVAVSFPNGTIINVARIEGTSHYNEVMARLSLKQSAHPTPPYYDCGAANRDMFRQMLRSVRKRQGFPADSDVAALADVLKPLVKQTNTFMATHSYSPIELAFLTVPDLPAIYVQDLMDTSAYLNVQLLTLPWWMFRSGDQAQWPVSHLNTAFGGMGYSLYNQTSSSTLNSLEPDLKFEKVELKTPFPPPPTYRERNVFSVLLTHQALTAHVIPLGAATHYFSANGIANFTLGLPPSPSTTYWSSIRTNLRIALNSYLNRGHTLDLVISHGEHASNPTFDTILREEVLAAQEDDEHREEMEFVSRDPVYAAAKGAAEFMRRFCLDKRGSCMPDISPKMPGW